MRVFKKALREFLSARGYTLTKMKLDARMEGALKRVARRHPDLKTVIDIGASDGRWAVQAMVHLKTCDYLLIEAQPVHQSALQLFAQRHPNVQVALAAAGDKLGEIYFWANDPMGGQAAYTPYPADNLVVPLTTVDHEVAQRKLGGPFLLKLDTHGFEMPILRGAATTLAAADVVVMECYNYAVARDSVLFYDMCAYMRSLGFQCLDLVDVSLSPDEKILWQMDLVFDRWQPAAGQPPAPPPQA